MKEKERRGGRERERGPFFCFSKTSVFLGMRIEKEHEGDNPSNAKVCVCAYVVSLVLLEI